MVADALRSIEVGEETDGPLWRRQCARNLMDCYSAVMEAMGQPWGQHKEGRRALEVLGRLMVDGMTAVKTPEDERVFYRMAAAACFECLSIGGEKAAFFRIYALLFRDLAAEQEG
jgi:hypothetical protein